MKADFRQINEKIDSSNERTKEEFREIHEKIIRMSESINDGIDKINDNTDEKIKNIKETISQRVDQTKEELIGLKEELTTRINNMEINNKISVTEVQAETQEKLDEVQINIAGRIEIVNNEITQIKTQVDQNKGTVENIQNQELINIKESIENLQNRPMYLAHHIAPDQKENINFKIYRGNPIEFLGRIDEWFGRIDVYKRQP